MDLIGLRAELDADPLARGYIGMTDQQAADDLNTAYRTQTRTHVFGFEIYNATDDLEYSALTEAQKTSWDNLCAIDQIDVTSGVAKSREAELFGPGTATRTNLLALKTISITRAQELGILGSSIEVGPAHVAAARAL